MTDNFYDLRFKWTATARKPDFHSWWISKMQSGREYTLEERYTIKFCFKLGKNATETYGTLQTDFGASCMNRTSVFELHKRFKEGRESVRSFLHFLNNVWPLFLSSFVISLRNTRHFNHQLTWQQRNILKKKNAEYAVITFFIQTFLSPAISSNIHCYFINIVHEFKVLKRVITTAIFNVAFHITFIKFSIICFFKCSSYIYIYIYIYIYTT